jgi:hypothetical protein
MILAALSRLQDPDTTLSLQCIGARPTAVNDLTRILIWCIFGVVEKSCTSCIAISKSRSLSSYGSMASLLNFVWSTALCRIAISPRIDTILLAVLVVIEAGNRVAAVASPHSAPRYGWAGALSL